jgi:hypothetical protein
MRSGVQVPLSAPEKPTPFEVFYFGNVSLVFVNPTKPTNSCR